MLYYVYVPVKQKLREKKEVVCLRVHVCILYIQNSKTSCEVRRAKAFVPEWGVLLLPSNQTSPLVTRSPFHWKMFFNSIEKNPSRIR